jgi:hypothetical protein
MTTEAFITALLLTRSPRLAEEAVIRALERSDSSAESVLRKTVTEALKVGVDASNIEVSVSSAILPPELRWLLAVPFQRQRCFVLRFLVCMTREECAQALNIEPSLVDQEVVEAVTRRAVSRGPGVYPTTHES